MIRRPRLAWVGLPAAVALLVMAPGRPAGVSARPADPAPPAADAFRRDIVPFLDKYCNSCHNSDKEAGGLALDVYPTEAAARKERKVWEGVVKALAHGEMPPKKKPQPGKDELAAAVAKIEAVLTRVDCSAPDPGRVTLRRLNRAEYDNTVRDLCGVSVTPADDFPADDVGYGFDNIGDVLSLPPILLEKYLLAADKVLEAAVGTLAPVPSGTQKFAVQNFFVLPRAAIDRRRPGGDRKVVFTTDGTATLRKHHFEADGEYVFRVKAWGRPAGGQPARLAVRVGDAVHELPVDAAPDAAAVYEARLRVDHGERPVAVAFANPSDPAKLAKGEEPRALGFEGLEVEGPLGGAPRPLSESMKKILVALPKSKADEPAAAEAVLAEFARRAYRRPVRPGEVDRLMRLYSLAAGQGDPWEKALKLPLKAVLCSPHFLFRVEDDPPPGAPARALTDFELASRLSYFLWSSMPDDELFGAAARGELRKPGALAAQVRRMLKDPKAEALAENFAGQWLNLRLLEIAAPDEELFPGWSEEVAGAVAQEPRRMFAHVVAEDKSVLDLLDADYTFLNEALARHYGVKGVEGKEFRKVGLADRRRGGVVTMASTLVVTANPTRTSPVKRGKWVYENVLGLQAPPPAPDVPELPPAGEIKGTLRQQMEQHRANPACATCHAKLDPLGFGLENFDAVGRWRDKDNGQPVDSSGELPDGARFAGPAALKQVLVGKADQFRRCLAEKLLTYALGRGLEYYDKCALDEVVGKLKAGSDKFSALVLAVAESDAFQKRAAKRSE